jgi:hypothetical protein
MKKINKGELYLHLSDFLKKKGVELHKGPYPGRIEHVCRLLTETINATQTTLGRARDGMDRGLQQVRQALKKKPPKSTAKASPFAASAAGASRKPGKKAAKTVRTTTRKAAPKRKPRTK